MTGCDGARESDADRGQNHGGGGGDGGGFGGGGGGGGGGWRYLACARRGPLRAVCCGPRLIPFDSADSLRPKADTAAQGRFRFTVSCDWLARAFCRLPWTRLWARAPRRDFGPAVRPRPAVSLCVMKDTELEKLQNMELEKL